jgi:peptidoglycan/LPS O-acetylase OafA/YrhL
MAAQKRLDIQGLRAIAVLAVLFFHAEKTLLPGGFIGVDIFFVLSGYLITGILLRPMATGDFSIVDFYQRRIRRLFPALFTVMGAALVAGLLIFPPEILNQQVESQFFTSFFLSNFYFEENTNYFDLEVELMPLLHTWSLGVEEQFYILFPPILLALHRWCRPYLMPVLAVFALISLYFSQVWLAEQSKQSFFFPTSRAFELLIGSLCVGLEGRLRLSQSIKQVVSTVALGAMVLGFFVINERSAFPGVLALLPCLSTAALLLTRDAWVNRLISVRPLTWFGDLSYSLYLWHWPILVFTWVLFPSNVFAVIVAVLLSIAVSALSYRYIERPFLEKQPKRLFLKAGIVSSASILICLAIYSQEGLPQRFSPEARSFLAASEDHHPERKKCHARSTKPRDYEETCIHGAADTAPGFAVWGDSHGAEVAYALGQRLGENGEALRSMTMSGCPAMMTHRESCTDNNQRILKGILNDPDMHTIILSQNLHGRDFFAEKAVAGVKETALKLKNAGKRVYIIYPLPRFDFDPPSMLAMRVRSGKEPESVVQRRSLYDTRRGHIAEDLSEFAIENGITGVPTVDLFCDEEFCRSYINGVGVTHFNQGHISLTGASLVVDRLFEYGLLED